MTVQAETPLIYVGTYQKYNEGSLFGKWIPLDHYIDKQEFITACKLLHKDESDPELMFQDYEGLPSAMVGESYIDDAVWDLMSHEADLEAKTAFVELYGSWDTDKFEEAFQGAYDSEIEFTYQLVDNCGTLDGMPEFLQQYFDYEAFNRDLFISDYTYIDGFVFRADV